ncbi:class I SAM-dependent methyltransferase [Loktanella agnita]|uniref:class I SAM-dependent methyltransferase n=1 Tax=Loktanella agnita TaxID=287097 RepID=UPI0039871142
MDRDVYLRMAELEQSHWWFRARRVIIARVIERLVQPKPGASLLEAGCGSGGNLDTLQKFGHVDAFEFDDQARAMAAERSGLEIPHGALPDALPFEGKSYDVIGIFDVLEHVEADGDSLMALKGRLAKGGALVVTVPAFPALWSRHDETHHHFRRYTRASMKKVAEAAGMQVEHAFYFNSLLFPLAIATRAAKSVLRSDTPDDALPAPWLNAVLCRVFAAERYCVGRFSLPFGLSLCVVLRIADPD